MLSSLTLATLGAAALLPANLNCRLQPNASWNTGARDVSAVICEGRRGFFVPSAEYRDLVRPEKSRVYRLLESELKLATSESDALRKSAALSAAALKEWKDLAAFHRGKWREAEDDVQAMAQDVAAAAERGWYESPVLWAAVGALTVAVVVALTSGDPPVAVVTP